ncbi:hypothetical protein [Ensifer sp.]|uniref:hypothetical protein n=1 Tax=Ensifer sp. TaxID=1872086 RepID=UPI002E124D4D|nr:hypothetical protein [Ensifer sp.]
MEDFIFPGRAKPGSGTVDKRNLPSRGAGNLSPEDARAYADDLLRSALEDPSAYTAEGLRKSLGKLSEGGDGTYSARPRKGLGGMQGNLEGVKTELNTLQSEVKNVDGMAALKDIVSSIQSMQELLADKEQQGFYEDPYRNQPKLPDNCEELPWNNSSQARPISLGASNGNKDAPQPFRCVTPPTPWNNPKRQPISLRKALDTWRE